MRRHLVKTLSITAVTSALAVAAVMGAASAQDMLPPGPGMEQTMKACGDCHGVGQIIGLQRSAAEWSDTIVAMINLGAPVAENDFDAIVTYLATYFGTEPPPAAGAAAPATEVAPAAPAAPAAAPATEAAPAPAGPAAPQAPSSPAP
jgi:hypothetical protein